MEVGRILLTTLLVHFLCSTFSAAIGLKADERVSASNLSPRGLETMGAEAASVKDNSTTASGTTSTSSEAPATTGSTSEAPVPGLAPAGATVTATVPPASDPVGSEDSKRPAGKKLVCLYGAFAAYRAGLGQFTTDKIDPYLCTHVIHGSFGFSENFTLESAHPHIDYDDDNHGFGLLKKLAALKQTNPDLKTLISVGGSEVTSGEFSSLAQNPEWRRQFAASVVEFLAKHQLDGVDINWQFPGAFTGDAEADKAAFVELLADLRAALEPHNYLLSAQVAAAYKLIKMGYDIRKVSEPLDLILLMAYDYHERRDNWTSLIAPLYGSQQDLFDRDNVNWSVKHWLKWGAPADKLILGLTSYAFSFSLSSAGADGIGAPVEGPGEEGPYIKMPGLWGYNEVCEAFGRERGWKKVIEGNPKAVYAVRGRHWISYECRKSLELKTRYALANGLGGLGFYSLDTDDFLGHCHNATFPLARRVRRTIQRGQLSNKPAALAESAEGGQDLADNHLLTFDD